MAFIPLFCVFKWRPFALLFEDLEGSGGSTGASIEVKGVWVARVHARHHLLLGVSPRISRHKHRRF